MEHLGVNGIMKSKSKTFSCEICNYITSQKANYEKHLLTNKHKKLTMVDICKHKCACGQMFKHRQSLHRHKKNCKYEEILKAKVSKVLKDAPKPICECGATFARNGDGK
jgi:hypothetical protein